MDKTQIQEIVDMIVGVDFVADNANEEGSPSPSSLVATTLSALEIEIAELDEVDQQLSNSIEETELSVTAESREGQSNNFLFLTLGTIALLDLQGFLQDHGPKIIEELARLGEGKLASRNLPKMICTRLSEYFIIARWPNASLFFRRYYDLKNCSDLIGCFVDQEALEQFGIAENTETVLLIAEEVDESAGFFASITEKAKGLAALDWSDAAETGVEFLSSASVDDLLVPGSGPALFLTRRAVEQFKKEDRQRFADLLQLKCLRGVWISYLSAPDGLTVGS